MTADGLVLPLVGDQRVTKRLRHLLAQALPLAHHRQVEPVLGSHRPSLP